jgi:antitoxin ParD1/3/4
MSQLAVHLPAELHDFVQSAIESGDYTGANDLVTRALYAYRDQMELDRIKLQRLRQDIQKGIDQLDHGEFVSDFDVEQFLIERKRARATAALAA